MSLRACNEQMVHDSEAEVEMMRLKVEKAREKVAQLKLALREKRGQAKGCSLFQLFVLLTIILVLCIIAVLHKLFSVSLKTCPIFSLLCLQCFDAVGWAAGRASGL